MDIIIIIAFLALYYILGLATVIALRTTGIEKEVKLEVLDYIAALMFPLLLFVIFIDWMANKVGK